MIEIKKQSLSETFAVYFDKNVHNIIIMCNICFSLWFNSEKSKSMAQRGGRMQIGREPGGGRE